jgi:glucokinase
VTIENDANAAAWGEFRFGAGKDVENLILVTLGTGVGGGVISHGVLLRGTWGTGGELGHYYRTPRRSPLRMRQPGMPRSSRLWHCHS